MFRSNKPRIANFRADYAKPADFCDVFNTNTKPLYLLAFLLTANHKDSERSFVSTLEEAFQEQAVFKEWAQSWVKRRLIVNAIETVAPASARHDQTRDFWNAAQNDTQRECEIDTVVKMAAFERFVFVLSVLERYSHWDCSLLLGCGMNKVAQARIGALRQLADLSALFPRDDRLPLRRLELSG